MGDEIASLSLAIDNRGPCLRPAAQGKVFPSAPHPTEKL